MWSAPCCSLLVLAWARIIASRTLLSPTPCTTCRILNTNLNQLCRERKSAASCVNPSRDVVIVAALQPSGAPSRAQPQNAVDKVDVSHRFGTAVCNNLPRRGHILILVLVGLEIEARAKLLSSEVARP